MTVEGYDVLQITSISQLECAESRQERLAESLIRPVSTATVQDFARITADYAEQRGFDVAELRARGLIMKKKGIPKPSRNAKE